jgi:hypothetical protein
MTVLWAAAGAKSIKSDKASEAQQAEAKFPCITPSRCLHEFDTNEGPQSPRTLEQLVHHECIDIAISNPNDCHSRTARSFVLTTKLNCIAR